MEEELTETLKALVEKVKNAKAPLTPAASVKSLFEGPDAAG